MLTSSVPWGSVEALADGCDKRGSSGIGGGGSFGLVAVLARGLAAAGRGLAAALARADPGFAVVVAFGVARLGWAAGCSARAARFSLRR